MGQEVRSQESEVSQELDSNSFIPYSFSTGLSRFKLGPV